MPLFATTNAGKLKEHAIQSRMRAAVERSLRPRIARELNRAAIAAADAYKVEGSSGAILSLSDHSERLFDIMLPYGEIMINRSIKHVKRELTKKVEDPDTDIVEAYIRSWMVAYLAEDTALIASTSEKLIREAVVSAVAQGLTTREVADEIIKSTGGVVAKTRAGSIGEVTAHSINQKATLEAVKGLDASPHLKAWVSMTDSRVRDTHREMTPKPPIPMNDKFKVRKKEGGHDYMDTPGDPTASAGNRINCRCATVYPKAT